MEREGTGSATIHCFTMWLGVLWWTGSIITSGVQKSVIMFTVAFFEVLQLSIIMPVPQALEFIMYCIYHHQQYRSDILHYCCTQRVNSVNTIWELPYNDKISVEWGWYGCPIENTVTPYDHLQCDMVRNGNNSCSCFIAVSFKRFTHLIRVNVTIPFCSN